jgi:hypothetical protein
MDQRQHGNADHSKDHYHSDQTKNGFSGNFFVRCFFGRFIFHVKYSFHRNPYKSDIALEIVYRDFVKKSRVMLQKACTEDRLSDFSADCIEISPVFLRMERHFCAV